MIQQLVKEELARNQRSSQRRPSSSSSASPSKKADAHTSQTLLRQYFEPVERVSPVSPDPGLSLPSPAQLQKKAHVDQLKSNSFFFLHHWNMKHNVDEGKGVHLCHVIETHLFTVTADLYDKPLILISSSQLPSTLDGLNISLSLAGCPHLLVLLTRDCGVKDVLLKLNGLVQKQSSENDEHYKYVYHYYLKNTTFSKSFSTYHPLTIASFTSTHQHLTCITI